MSTRYPMAVLGVLLSLFVFGKTDGAEAYSYDMDEFSIVRNGLPYFSDTFSDGFAPSSAPNYSNGSAASYYVRGTVGPEAGGLLTLNSSGAVPSYYLSGYLTQFATLQTSMSSDTGAGGLKSGMTFSVTGIFNLISPDVSGEMYGIRLGDWASGKTPNDYVYLGANKIGNDLNIQLISRDYIEDTRVLLGSTTLDLNHDYIAFILAKEDATSNAIKGSYAYIDEGIWGPIISFDTTRDIFNGEAWTRAEFFAATPTPLPGALLLFGSGLLGLMGIGRRRWKKS